MKADKKPQHLHEPDGCLLDVFDARNSGLKWVEQIAPVRGIALSSRKLAYASVPHSVVHVDLRRGRWKAVKRRGEPGEKARGYIGKGRGRLLPKLRGKSRV